MQEISQDIIAHAKENNSSAFDQIVRWYLPAIYRYCLYLTKEETSAQDIAQETFIRAWKNLYRFEVGRPLKPWLSRIAKNAFLDTLDRKRSVAFSHLSETDETFIHQIPDTAPLPTQVAEQHEQTATIANALGHLKPNEEEVMHLHYVQEMTAPEIANLLNIPYETVRTRLRRGRQNLRPHLQGEY